jgi:hypothetical protein
MATGSETPLSDLMVGVLRALSDASKRGEFASTPNQIALDMGLDADVRRLGKGSRSWTGHMAPAQRIIFPLIALRRRELVGRRRRPGGRSGTAYGITNAGRDALAQHEVREASRGH